MTPQPSDHTALLRESTTAFFDVLDTCDHRIPVPTCPGWSLGDLGRHLESVHRWALAALLEGRDDDSVADDLSLQGRSLAEGYRRTASALVTALEATAPQASCWTFGPPPHTAAFWRRRQAFETVIHVVDARSAAGLPLRPISSGLAADGVDEVVGMFFPRQVRLGRIEALTGALALASDDAPAPPWLLTGDGAGHADGEPDAVVSGTAWDLLLLLWQRIGLGDGLATGRLRVEGDPGVASSVLQAGLTP